MTPEQQEQWKERYNEAVQRYNEAKKDSPGEKIKRYFVTRYAAINSREFRAECMAEFKWEPENLKSKDKETFNLARQEYIDNEVERIKEQLVEGGCISPHSFFK